MILITCPNSLEKDETLITFLNKLVYIILEKIRMNLEWLDQQEIIFTTSPHSLVKIIMSLEQIDMTTLLYLRNYFLNVLYI